MYNVDIDLILHFAPPMVESGPGICLTRSIQLPFPPTNGISFYSKNWDEYLEGTPLGYQLKEITWDLDRKLFMAKTYFSIIGTPIALIPQEIYRLLKSGWNYGSFVDQYVKKDGRGRERSKLKTLRQIKRWDDDAATSWDSENTKTRPKDFMTVWHAVIATMAALGNNCSTAYAMLKTGVFIEIPEAKLPGQLSNLERKFNAAVAEFRAMSFDSQLAWCDRVKRKYPRMIDVVKAMGYL